MFEDRFPISYRSHPSQVTGTIADKINDSALNGHIRVTWEEVPLKRQLWNISMNVEAICAVGMYKTREREKYAKFTDPIPQIGRAKTVLIARREYAAYKDLRLLDLLNLPTTRFLVKDNASYGEYLDRALEYSDSIIIRTSAEWRSIAKMIAARRADVTVASKDEAIEMISRSGVGHHLQILEPSDMPTEELRFMMCSKLVPNELIQRFNHEFSKIRDKNLVKTNVP